MTYNHEAVQQQQLLEAIRAFFKLDHLLFLDFETYYKSKASGGRKSYSLKTKTYPEYILGDEFQITGLGWAYDLDPVDYVHDPEDIEDLFDEIRDMKAAGKRIGLVAQNTQFDASILSWRHGITFDWYFCTRLISVLLEVHASSSLKAQAMRMFPGDVSLQKGGAELEAVDGKRYEEITAEEQKHLGAYCCQDVFLTRRIFFNRMNDGRIPPGEVALMHITLRGAVEPQFVINKPILQEVVRDEERKKAEAISAAIQFCYDNGIEQVAPGTFSSNQKYANLLVRFGLTVPKKQSKTTGKMTEALGKNDPDYIKLQIKNPHLEVLYTAREAAKSTIAKTRAEKMISTAELFVRKCYRIEQGLNMPFFLNYYGAKNTGRWSGGEKLNQQNLQRGSKHRLALMAPEGHVIGVNDLSNIELRVNLWFCGQDDILNKFATDPNFDSYSDLASDIYNRPINKKDDPNERQIGKAGSLGLGFAMSWYGFQQYLAGGPLGMEPMFVSDDFAQQVKLAYDAKHYAIAAMWAEIEQYVLPVLATGGEYSFGRNKCVKAVKDALILPSGRVLRYPNCKVENRETRWGFQMHYECDSFTRDGMGRPLRRFLHKGLIIENIIQALARDILGYQMIKVNNALQERLLGYVMGSVHDELLSRLVESTADEGFAVMQENMRTLPQWAHGLPVASEGGYAKEYSK